MFKKNISILFATLGLLTIAGCSGKAQTDSTTSTTVTEKEEFGLDIATDDFVISQESSEEDSETISNKEESIKETEEIADESTKEQISETESTSTSSKKKHPEEAVVKTINISDEIKKITPILEATITAMYENDLKFDITNDETIWLPVYYFMNNYSSNYGYLNTSEDYSTAISKEGLQELLTTVYGVNTIPELPVSGVIIKNGDYYIAQSSDSQGLYIKTEDYIENTNSCVFDIKLYSQTDEELATYNVKLEKSSNQSTFIIDDYYYSIKTILKL